MKRKAKFFLDEKVKKKKKKKLLKKKKKKKKKKKRRENYENVALKLLTVDSEWKKQRKLCAVFL